MLYVSTYALAPEDPPKIVLSGVNAVVCDATNKLLRANPDAAVKSESVVGTNGFLIKAT